MATVIHNIIYGIHDIIWIKLRKETNYNPKKRKPWATLDVNNPISSITTPSSSRHLAVANRMITLLS